MPIDPDAPLPLGPDAYTASLSQAVADLQRELRNLRAGGVAVAVGDGAPTADPTTLREGTAYLDRVNRRRYYTLGGVWRYVALT